VEHRQVEAAASYRASGDDSARFLRELRQLRDGAGLGQAELAARAHYPYDRIKAAEVGPTLPDLPVLSAYVRGCGGTIEEWEERWRSLTSAPTLPLVDARPPGCSTAASAGARIGSISPVADTPDPSIILAALDRVAEQMAVGPPAPLPSRSGVSTIEQRLGIPSPAAAATTARSPGPKAGTAKVTAWETTTMRTAWSSAAAPTAPTAPTAREAEPLGEPESGGSVGGPGSGRARGSVSGAGSGVPGGSGQPAATKPGAGSTMATAVPRPITVGRRPQGLSRTTVAALIAIAVCVLVVLLAIFA
jgi:hypothetical protein